MSKLISVSSSPICLNAGVRKEDLLPWVERLFGENSDNFEFDENPNGTIEFGTQGEEIEVGSNFAGKLKEIALAWSGLLAKPFYFQIENCDALEDDRYERIYAGPTPEAADLLKKAICIESVISELEDAGFEQLKKPIEVAFIHLKDYISSRNEPPVIPPSLLRESEDAPKYFRTLLTVEIISEGEPAPETMDLESLHYEITSGQYSGQLLAYTSVELTPRQAVDALESQGSDPSFFNSLAEIDEDGCAEPNRQPVYF